MLFSISTMDIAPEIGNYDVYEVGIEPCRACGIYLTMEPDMIRPIFGETPTNMTEIVKQMCAWNIEVMPNDGRPQFMCVACISKFEKVLKFKLSCVETHEQFSDIKSKRPRNNIVIESEMEPEEEQFCAILHLDSDEEEAGSSGVCAAFDKLDVLIEEEHMARVPQEISTSQPSFQPVKFDISPVIELSDDDEADEALPVPLQELPKKWCCKLCTHKSQTQELHLHHMQRIHTLKKRECRICGKKFRNATDARLKFHMKWHQRNKHLKCAICGFFCNSKDTLKEHKVAVHTRFKCKFCGKRMKPKALLVHLNHHRQQLEAQLVEKETQHSNLNTILEAVGGSSNAELPSSSYKTWQEFNSISEVHKAMAAARNSKSTMPALPAEILTVPNLVVPVSSVAISGALQLPKIPTATTSCSFVIHDISSESSDDDIFEHFDVFEQKARSKLKQPSSKVLSKCQICGKAFDLQIKLNRHLQNAHNA